MRKRAPPAVTVSWACLLISRKASASELLGSPDEASRLRRLLDIAAMSWSLPFKNYLYTWTFWPKKWHGDRWEVWRAINKTPEQKYGKQQRSQ